MDDRAQKWYTNEVFNRGLDDQERILKNWIEEKRPEDWSPMVCVEAWDFERREMEHVICDIQTTEFNDYEVRIEIMRHLGRELGERPLACLAAFLITEGWASVQSGPVEDLTPASEDPDRVEVLAIAGQAIDGRCNLALLKVVRDKERMVRLDDWHRVTYAPTGNKEAQVPTLKELWLSYLMTVATKSAPLN